MAIPQNLKQFLSDAYQNAGVAGRAGKDPADAFRIKGNTISWDFEVETFETPVEQGIIPDNIRAAGARACTRAAGTRARRAAAGRGAAAGAAAAAGARAA